MIRKQPYTFYVLFVFLFLIPFGKAFAGWNNFIVNFDKKPLWERSSDLANSSL